MMFVELSGSQLILSVVKQQGKHVLKLRRGNQSRNKITETAKVLQNRDQYSRFSRMVKGTAPQQRRLPKLTEPLTNQLILT